MINVEEAAKIHPRWDVCWSDSKEFCDDCRVSFGELCIFSVLRSLACDQDPTLIFQKKIVTFAWDSVNGCFQPGTSGQIVNFSSHHPYLTLTTKISFPPPMRALSGIGALGEQLSIWIDHHLQPLVSNIPGYICDIKHLVSIMDGYPWSENLSWLSCNVVSIYPSLQQDTAIVILTKFLEKHSHYTPETKEFLVRATDFLLYHNYFYFDGNFLF